MQTNILATEMAQTWWGGHLRPEEASGRKGPEVNSEDQMLDEANEDVLAEINLGE